jgi:hypothetical protein
MSGRGVSAARKVGFGRASRKIWMGCRRGGECRNPAGGNEAKRDEFLKRGEGREGGGLDEKRVKNEV